MEVIKAGARDLKVWNMTNNLFFENVHISALVLEPGGGDELIEENSYYFDNPLGPDLEKKWKLWQSGIFYLLVY